jgi:hypothetical protein
MAALTNALEDLIYNYLARNTAPTAIGANLVVALFTAAPGEAAGGTEVSGGSYARVAVVASAAGWDLVSGTQIDNAADINFPVATASWGTVTHVALYNAAGTTMLAYGALTASKLVDNGDSFRFPAGSLVLVVDN